ncbi:MAG: glycosyltransferase family 4 protein [Smithellaceae bacterium]
MSTIVHLTTLHPRTDVRIFIKEARTLASRMPHKVVLIVADGKGSVVAEQGFVSIHDLGILGGGRLRRALIGPWRAFSAIRRLKPAVIHFHDPELIPLGMLLKVMGCKVVYDVHEDVPQQTFSKDWIPKFIRYPVMLAMRVLEWGAAKSFDAILPATPKIAEHFPANKTVVVQNFPISTELNVPSAILYEQRAFSFAYIGGIATIRGAIEMIRALEFLCDITGVSFELAGNFSPSSLEGALQDIPSWSQVHYHGQVSREQVAHIVGGVRAGVVLFHPLPNHIDAQPNKMFEYMSASIPVIASDFPLWRRIIDGTGSGLLVDPLDTKAISEAMRWILEHPAEAEEMGRRGRLAVEKIYNWDAEAVKLVSLYKKLLNS